MCTKAGASTKPDTHETAANPEPSLTLPPHLGKQMTDRAKPTYRACFSAIMPGLDGEARPLVLGGSSCWVASFSP